MKINPLTCIDFYKADHRNQYPKGTEYVYSNFTPRRGTHAHKDSKGIVFFGLQGFIKSFLLDSWNENFFNKPVDVVVNYYKRRMDNALGKDAIDCSHINELHELGYLPIKIKALPEGTFVPYGVPVLTIVNTDPKFFWITNYLESVMSAELWKASTSATISNAYKKEFLRHCNVTGSPVEMVMWQGHDFSFRGMGGVFDAAVSGAGHLTSFTGTDTVPAIDYIEYYYNGNSDNELIGGSVYATEHSVMCMGTFDGELSTFDRLISELYPKGIVSIVSDTWDYWKVVTEYLPTLKNKIMNRDGRVVIRPDSGDPVDIICGIKTYDFDTYYQMGEKPLKNELIDFLHNEIHNETPHGECGGDKTIIATWNSKTYEVTYEPSWNRYDKQFYYMDGDGELIIKEIELSPEQKGTYQLMWETFGGTINDNGFKLLDNHIGLIYGDSITIERQKEILNRLEDKKFTASNLVLGIGSYTYQYVTRDTHGFAMKATWGVVDGISRDIFKDPKTDGGTKKSAKGLLKVQKVDNAYVLIDQCSSDDENTGELTTVFVDGKLVKELSISEIRKNVDMI